MTRILCKLILLAAMVSQGVHAQTGDKVLQRCFERKATTAEKSRCHKELIGKSHEFTGKVIDLIGQSELKLDHQYGFFSHIQLTVAFHQKIDGKVKKGDKVVIIGTVESIFDDALNPMASIRNARFK